jgi:tRNA A37 threonylcarbamoyltransferase TsaD
VMRRMTDSLGVKLRVPTRDLSTDNAAMIGLVANLQWEQWQSSGADISTAVDYGIFLSSRDKHTLDRVPNLAI